MYSYPIHKVAAQWSCQETCLLHRADLVDHLPDMNCQERPGVSRHSFSGEKCKVVEKDTVYTTLSLTW